MVTCHEFSHGLAALLVGQHPIVYGVMEHDAASSHVAMAFIAGAGPVISLVLGIIFLQIEKHSHLQNIWRQLLLWFGLLSVAEFFGYLISPPFPFFASGDISGVIHALNWPYWTRLISFVIGFIGIIALGRLALQRLLPIVDPVAPLRPQLLRTGMLPWLIGTGIILATFASSSYATGLVAVVTAGIFTMLTGYFARSKKAVKSDQSGALFAGMSTKGTVVVAILLVAMIVIEQTVLQHGVRL
jgi:hypothetical protein